MKIEKKLKELTIELPKLPKSGGKYYPIKYLNENLFYVSGCGPKIGTYNCTGLLGDTVSLEEGITAAKACLINILAVIKNEIDDLDKIESFVKMTVFVASNTSFLHQPKVADGATELLEQIFGNRIAVQVCNWCCSAAGQYFSGDRNYGEN